MKLAAVVLALLVAGCATQGSDPAPYTPAATEVVQPPLPGENPPLENEPAPGALVSFPLAYEGKAETGACLSPLQPLNGVCHDAAQAENDQVLIEFDGKLQRLVGSVTWAPDSELTREMRAYLLVDYPNDTHDAPHEFYVAGESPLEFDWDLSTFADGDWYFFVDTTQTADARAATLWLSAPQAFRVDAGGWGLPAAPPAEKPGRCPEDPTRCDM